MTYARIPPSRASISVWSMSSERTDRVSVLRHLQFGQRLVAGDVKISHHGVAAAPVGVALTCQAAVGGLHGIGVEGRRLAQLQRSEEHTSELQSLMRISYAVFCLKKK